MCWFLFYPGNARVLLLVSFLVESLGCSASSSVQLALSPYASAVNGPCLLLIAAGGGGVFAAGRERLLAFAVDPAGQNPPNPLGADFEFTGVSGDPDGRVVNPPSV